MLEWNTRVPLRLGFDPLSTTAVPRTVGQQLSRELIGSMNPAAFHAQERLFSSAIGTQIGVDSRSGLFKQLQNQLSQLQASLALPALFQPAAAQTFSGGSAGTDTTIARRTALNLGSAANATLDPTQPLDTLPLTEPITAGQITLTTKPGSVVKTASISIDPTTDTINSVLSKLNGLTIGTTHPISASFNASTNQLTINGTSKGADFSLQDTGGGNFLAAFGDAGYTENEAVQGTKIAGGTKTQTTYDNLQVSYGTQTFTVSGLTVSKTTNLAKRAQQLAADLNANGQFSGAGLVATASKGKLQITGTNGALPPNLQLTELATSGSLSLGLDKSGAKATLGLTETVQLNTLGPQATLNALAGQLGLTPVNGQYQFAINGKTLTFSGSQTLNDVIGGINKAGAGVTATYDATGQRVVLTAQQPGPTTINAQDVQGNLLAQLGLTGANAQVVQGQGATAATATAADNPQLQNIAGLQAVNGQFAIQLNGNTITFNQTDRAQDVVARINEAQVGVTASYDATNQQFTLTGPQTQPPLTGTDLQGNFFKTVGRIVPEEATTNQLNPQALQGLQHIADQLNQVVGVLQTAGGANGAFKNDGLVRDLKDALTGLVSPANGQPSLADLGFSYQNGQVSFDATKFQQLAAANPSGVQSALNDVLVNRAAPLLAAGTQAISDEQALGPLQQRLAQQTVAVRGEIARLQSRQQLLLFEQANFEKEQATLKQQTTSLQGVQGKLNQGAQHDDHQPPTPAAAQPVQTIPPTPAPTPPTPSVPATEATGLLSFGLTS